MKLFMNCSKYIANKNIAVVSSKKNFEDITHEILEREDRGYNVTVIHIKTRFVQEEMEFSSEEEKQELMKKVHDNEKAYALEGIGFFRKKYGELTLGVNRYRPVASTRLLQSCDWTRKAAKLEIGPANVAIGDTKETSILSVKRYSKSFVMLEVDGINELPYIISDIDANGGYIPRTLYRYGNGAGESWLMVDP